VGTGVSATAASTATTTAAATTVAKLQLYRRMHVCRYPLGRRIGVGNRSNSGQQQKDSRGTGRWWPQEEKGQQHGATTEEYMAAQ
jgi:hypothetical protein